MTLSVAASTRLAQGNRSAGEALEVRKAFVEVATPELVRQVVGALAEKAREGNLPAIRLFLGYLAGPPSKAHADRAGESEGPEEAPPTPATPLPAPGPVAAAADSNGPNGVPEAKPTPADPAVAVPNGSNGGPAAPVVTEKAEPGRPQTGQTVRSEAMRLARPTLGEMWAQQYLPKGKQR